MNAENVALKIADLRKNKGLTQKQLAEKLFVTDKAVSKWERGINYPDLTILEQLAFILGVTVSELLGLKNETFEDIITATTEIAKQEKINIRNMLKFRAWINIIIGIGLAATQIMSSYIFYQANMYGLPQLLTIGMLGFTGLIAGCGLYSLFNLRKL